MSLPIEESYLRLQQRAAAMEALVDQDWRYSIFLVPATI